MISDNLLIHSAVAHPVTGRDMDGEPVEGEAINLDRIRVIYSDNQTSGKDGKAPASTATLYFDTSRSGPADFIPVKNMRITFENKDFIVMDIKKAYGTKSAPEFYKVVLNG